MKSSHVEHRTEQPALLGSNRQKRCKEAQQKMGTMDMTPYIILSENLLNQIIRVLTLEQKKNSLEKK